MTMLRTIHLHGAAKLRFGGPYRFAVETPIEAVRALYQLRGFGEFIRSADWKVIRGRGTAGRRITAEELGLQFGSTVDLHLVPVAAGRGSGKGTGKIILGVALAAAAIIGAAPSGGATAWTFGAEIAGSGITFGNVASVGASLILGGVSALLAPGVPKVRGYSSREPADVNKPSFLFNGPVNTVAQGATIPVICGRRVRVGSVVISAGIFTERFVPS